MLCLRAYIYKNVNEELKLITEWFHTNKLSLNFEKTNNIFFLSLTERNVISRFRFKTVIDLFGGRITEPYEYASCIVPVSN